MSNGRFQNSFVCFPSLGAFSVWYGFVFASSLLPKKKSSFGEVLSAGRQVYGRVMLRR